MRRAAAFLAPLLALLTLPLPAAAQTPSIQSISPGIDLGPVASAGSGTTLFRASAATGAVTHIGGTGYRVGGGTARALVTLSCGASPLCAAEPVLVTISSIGAPSGRLGALDSFTAQENTAVFTTPPVGTDPLILTIAPIGQNSTRSFYVGADIPVLGDNSGEPSGPAASPFRVDVEIAAPGGDSDAATGQATAETLSALNLEAETGLAFGAIVRPTSGDGTVAIDAGTGQRILAGTGVHGVGAAPSRAVFTVTGEDGQAFSVSMLGTFEMTGPGAPIVVTLSADADGLQVLDGPAQFHVGGSFGISSATTPGAYSGNFSVTVQYE